MSKYIKWRDVLMKVRIRPTFTYLIQSFRSLRISTVFFSTLSISTVEKRKRLITQKEKKVNYKKKKKRETERERERDLKKVSFSGGNTTPYTYTSFWGAGAGIQLDPYTFIRYVHRRVTGPKVVGHDLDSSCRPY